MKKSVKGICLGLIMATAVSMSAFAAEISEPVVTPDKEAKTATVSVEVSDPAKEQYVTVLVVKNGVKLASVSESDIAYVDQVAAVDGKAEFKLGVDTEKFGEKFTVYVGGTGVSAPVSQALSFSKANNPGDADGDNIVNIRDYNAVIDAFGSSKGDENYNENVDFDGNDVVNILDYGVVIDAFGTIY